MWYQRNVWISWIVTSKKMNRETRWCLKQSWIKWMISRKLSRHWWKIKSLSEQCSEESLMCSLSRDTLCSRQNIWNFSLESLSTEFKDTLLLPALWDLLVELCWEVSLWNSSNCKEERQLLGSQVTEIIFGILWISEKFSVCSLIAALVSFANGTVGCKSVIGQIGDQIKVNGPVFDGCRDDCMCDNTPLYPVCDVEWV